MEALLDKERKNYHKFLLESGILTIDKEGIPSNADKSSALSIKIAKGIAARLMAGTAERTVGQTAGAKFEFANMEFLLKTFPKLQHIRPGEWNITKLGNRNSVKISSFAQYEHLEYLNRIIESDSKLAASMGNDYIVSPDIVIYRCVLEDKDINIPQIIVNDSVAK